MAVLIAAAIAVPAGWAIGHTGRGREVAVALSGAARAVPSFGLVLLLVLVLGVTHKIAASITAFVLLAIRRSSRGRTPESRPSNAAWSTAPGPSA